MENFNIVLFKPEIPGNTGSIGRTCVALNVRLILIKPYGFDLSEKAVRRAGLDYWKHVKLQEYETFEDFLIKENPPLEKLFFYSRKASNVYYNAHYSKGCFLIFGAETKGLPPSFWDSYPCNFYKLPAFSDEIRSLNLANTVTAVAYEGIRHLFFEGLPK